MRIVLFTFHYPPDLSAGSFRAAALVEALAKKLGKTGEIIVITTHPNRYASYKIKTLDKLVDENVKIYRKRISNHRGGMFSLALAFCCYMFYALKQSIKVKPDLLIGTTSRLMTGVLTMVSACILRKRYFIDLRDIFSEGISDIFSKKNKFLGSLFRKVFSCLEMKVLSKAVGVNVVSSGFPAYYQEMGVDTSNWSFFPNGVDQEFQNFKGSKLNQNQKEMTVLYAGNIGIGQGLENILPELAKQVEGQFKFLLIGDGSTRLLLERRLKEKNVQNLEILEPVSREDLFMLYEKADLLFLHLNDIPAFKRVLPSKIFEYVALGKPIVAGLSGYPAKFLKEKVPHSFVFDPTDIKGCIKCLTQSMECEVSIEAVRKFVSQYNRASIMDSMAAQLLVTASKG